MIAYVGLKIVLVTRTIIIIFVDVLGVVDFDGIFMIIVIVTLIVL